MADVFANRCPAIGVLLVGQRAKLEPDIAIRLVQVTLLKFFDHYFLLHIQHLRIERQAQHPVRFEPEGRFQVSRRKGNVIIGNVGAGKGVIFATNFLQRFVVTRDILRSTKHQMLK